MQAIKPIYRTFGPFYRASMLIEETPANDPSLCEAIHFVRSQMTARQREFTVLKYFELAGVAYRVTWSFDKATMPHLTVIAGGSETLIELYGTVERV